MTNNGEVNLVLAQRAVEEFEPPILAAFPRKAQSATGKVNQVLIENLSLKTWNQLLKEGQYKLGKTSLSEE